MRTGRPRSVKLKKSYKLKRGAAKKGARSAKQISAAIGRRRVRRSKGRR